MNKKKAIVICGHGSKTKNGVNAFLDLFDKIKTAYPNFLVDYGFIEYSNPLLPEILEKIIKSGIKDIIVVPSILFTGVHFKNDIPYMINETRKKHKKIKIRLAGYIGISKKIIDLCEKNIRLVLQSNKNVELQDTNLLIIGVGSSRAEANIDIAALTRHIWEKTNVHFALYSFISKMTFPTIEDSLKILENLPQKNFVILPYLLFPGAYLSMIQQKIDEFTKHSNKNILITKTLENDDLVIEAFKERIHDVTAGNIDYAKDIPKSIKSRLS